MDTLESSSDGFLKSIKFAKFSIDVTLKGYSCFNGTTDRTEVM